MTLIVLSGLTAAGKTTHAKLIANELKREVLHTTDFLLRAMNVHENLKDIWVRRLHELEKLRDSSTIDDQVDEFLHAQIRENTGLVVDSWALPWHSPIPNTLNIWIGSDRVSRAWKCGVSDGAPSTVTTRNCLDLVDEKDSLSRCRFVSRYGFDLFVDRGPFGLILDNSHLMTEPSVVCSQKGIEIFQRVLMACIRSVLDDDPSPAVEMIERGDRDELACLAELRHPIFELVGAETLREALVPSRPTRVL